MFLRRKCFRRKCLRRKYPNSTIDVCAGWMTTDIKNCDKNGKIFTVAFLIQSLFQKSIYIYIYYGYCHPSEILIFTCIMTRIMVKTNLEMCCLKKKTSLKSCVSTATFFECVSKAIRTVGHVLFASKLLGSGWYRYTVTLWRWMNSKSKDGPVLDPSSPPPPSQKWLNCFFWSQDIRNDLKRM